MHCISSLEQFSLLKTEYLQWELGFKDRLWGFKVWKCGFKLFFGSWELIFLKLSFWPCSWDEINTHSVKASRWIVIDNLVYDVTTWSRKHPGGSILLGHFAGQDATVSIFLNYSPSRMYSFMDVCYPSGTTRCHQINRQALSDSFINIIVWVCHKYHHLKGHSSALLCHMSGTVIIETIYSIKFSDSSLWIGYNHLDTAMCTVWGRKRVELNCD